MPQSLDKVLIHLVFSTKDRYPYFDRPILPHLHAYLATVARHAGCECPRVGGTIDNQERHHQSKSYQSEFRALLKKCGVACDERYVWD